jgi:predicted nucleic acid-binding Zn ribbon protein
MKAAPERKCPKCKKMSLKRLIGGGAGVIFKGTGFYQTDYKSKGSGSDAKKSSEGGSEKSAGAKDSKSPDKK